MELKFSIQPYQTDAVNSIVRLFEGMEIKQSQFTIDISQGLGNSDGFALEGQSISYLTGFSNKMTLTDSEILQNVRKIQDSNNIRMATRLESRDFSVEMETGTGKTYVYTKTILEFNKLYGMTKFIIVVPSIAIKEGVYKSLEITESHFKSHYDNVIYNYFIYDSNRLERIQSFATSSNIEIMIINIDAFRKSFTDPEKETKANIIHRPNDKLSGNKPIDLIANTNPIVIIDEPQSVDNTPNAKQAIKTLKPLITLRYSATHRELYNLMYRLTPVDAYHQNLVKRIEVSSIIEDLPSYQAYVKLISVNSNNGISAVIEYNQLTKTNEIKKVRSTVRMGDDLWELSNELDYYKNQNFIVDDIDAFEGNENIVFLNGEKLLVGDSINDSNPSVLKRAQIRETIDQHLRKEKHYLSKGIKVISLFFLDEVKNYRLYDKDGNQTKGEYALWFEEEFEKLINGKYKFLKQEFPNVNFNSSDIHDGYFSIDKKGKFVDSKNGDSAEDESAYHLIMVNKERLLSMEEPKRFIFSHSALKEGWDNPNVFQVCTLVDTKDTMSKRQKIGRGLRLCVDQSGERVVDMKYNQLCVIANESYHEFAETLQKEFEKDGYKFGVVDTISFKGLTVHSQYGELHTMSEVESIKLHKYLKDSGYLKPNGKVEEKFYVDLNDKNFTVPEEFELYKDSIISEIQYLSKEIEIKNIREKVEIKLNKEVYLSESFQKLWDKIKHKTLYKVNLNIEKFISACAYNIEHMPSIKAEVISKAKAKLDIESKGVTVKEESFAVIADVTEFENLHYPDLVRRLQDNTQLLRKTIIEILQRTKRVEDFFKNPEVFISQVTRIIKEVKTSMLNEGIEYYKLNEEYVQTQIFDDTELFGYKDYNVLDISDKKNIYDHVLFDSIIEKQFAMDAEGDEDVILYAKLPSSFKVDTPFGKYNPDWVVVIQKDNEDKLYFVAETKGTSLTSELRGGELSKILCGRKHFEVVDNELKYEVVTSLKVLKEYI